MTALYAEGKEHLHRCEYKKALKDFTRAIDAYQLARDTTVDLAIVYSARSAAHFCLEKYDKALQDAIQTVEMRPDWSKGYFRKAEALSALQQAESALEAYRSAHSRVRGGRVSRGGWVVGWLGWTL